MTTTGSCGRRAQESGRREFLSATALGAAGALVVPCTAFGRSRAAPRVVIPGGGYVGAAAARACLVHAIERPVARERRRSLDRLSFSASVEIRAGPGQVFDLVSDLRQKAALNSHVKVIRVEIEEGESIRPGTVFRSRLQKGRRIFEYRSRCVRMERPYLLETRSDTDPPFQVRVILEPTLEGCRLTQEETLEVTPELLNALEPVSAEGRTFRDVMELLAFFPGLRHLGLELQTYQRERLARRLTAELQAWLDAIKGHIEAQAATGEGRTA